MMLHHLALIETDLQPADFWIVPRGANRGHPRRDWQPGRIGIRVTALDRLVPGYLYYWFEYAATCTNVWLHTPVLTPDDLRGIEVTPIR